jgi:small subunit ribosomal protein S13
MRKVVKLSALKKCKSKIKLRLRLLRKKKKNYTSKISLFKNYKKLKNFKSLKDKYNLKKDLKRIYGLGHFIIKEIFNLVGINQRQKLLFLEPDDHLRIEQLIQKYTDKGRLRGQVRYAVRHYLHLKNYRGFCHAVGLPVRGQRSRTNSRTRKKGERFPF